MSKEFEYFKYLRRNKQDPFQMYNVCDVDISEEEDDETLLDEYGKFVARRSCRDMFRFGIDATEWAEGNINNTLKQIRIILDEQEAQDENRDN